MSENINDIKLRITFLVNTLNQYNYQYYVLDSPTVSDIEYDSLMRELEYLEKTFNAGKNSLYFISACHKPIECFG